MVLIEHIQHQGFQRIRADQAMVCSKQPAFIVAPGLHLQCRSTAQFLNTCCNSALLLIHPVLGLRIDNGSQKLQSLQSAPRHRLHQLHLSMHSYIQEEKFQLPAGYQLTKMMLRLKMLLLPIKLLISSKKLSVTRPPIWLKLISTTMLSTRHLSSFTCRPHHCRQCQCFGGRL